MSSPSQQPLPRMLAAVEVIPTIQRIIAGREALRDLVPWLEEEDLNQGTEAVIDMYRYAGSDQETRDAAEGATRLMSECAARLTSRRDLFLRVKAVADKDDYSNEECRKAVRDILREYTNVGHGKLSSDQMEMLLDARKEIDRLCQDFNRNLRENIHGAWFTHSELDGLSLQDIRRLTKKGKDKVYIDFGNRADRLLILRCVYSPATRKKLYLGNAQKLSENIALFKKVIILRNGNARLLGFKSHAEFKLQKRIAPSIEWVDGMLMSMRERVLPRGHMMMEQLRALKRKHFLTETESWSDEIFPWDFHYYMRLLEDEKQVDQELVSEYFPLRNTVLRMLGRFESFLQLHFKPMAPEELAGRTWNEDVEGWSVWDEREEHVGEFIGYLFSDILYRNGKYKGNQNVNLQASYLKPDGRRVFPATILMCNFYPLGTTGCVLLRHSELITLFHELGHGIHDLLSRTLHTRYHAWRTPLEFGEALSTMLENWCWNKSELKEISCHYTALGPEYLQKWKGRCPGATQPAEHISEELLDQLVSRQNLDKVPRILQQIADSVFDMAVHNPASPEHLAQLDATELYNNIKEELTLLRNPKNLTRGPAHCHFGHLMSGYDAGYFSYLSAQIFAADFYETAFAANPQSRQAWDRYRRVVLEAGGSRDESKLMEEFLGHSLKSDALDRSLGPR